MNPSAIRRLVMCAVLLASSAARAQQTLGRPGNPPAPLPSPALAPPQIIPPQPNRPANTPPGQTTPAQNPPVVTAPVQTVTPQSQPPGQPGPARQNFSHPLDGLTFAEAVTYGDGLEEFRKVETPATGLGPIFNDVSCVACHDAGGVGGAGRTTVTRFGRTINGVFDPLTELGGPLLQDRAIDRAALERIPAQANTITRRVTTPLFGAGLIEAIPDSTIVLGALRAKPPGIGGRISVVRDVTTGTNRVGRFGWKAQQATLLAFAGDAYLNEMGITNRFFPAENAPNGNRALLARFDRTPDLEDLIDPADGNSDTDRLADFMRLLAPPPRGVTNASTLAGEQRFVALACAACHTPSLTTGRSPIAALSEKSVALYSDLLLHDMGSLGDGIVQGTAGAREMRTAPLWGLRARPTWLHDGRARTIDDAIRGHDGEARNSRDAYLGLSNAERQQLLDFLNSI